MTSWIKELFGTEKPIIAMCHLQAMPGDPYYDSAKGMKEVLEKPAMTCWPCSGAAWTR